MQNVDTAYAKETEAETDKTDPSQEENSQPEAPPDATIDICKSPAQLRLASKKLDTEKRAALDTKKKKGELEEHAARTARNIANNVPYCTRPGSVTSETDHL